MKRVFTPRSFSPVPDGTEVSPFLNACDVNQTEVPWGVLRDMSVAAGRIAPGISSWIHIHPLVAMVTYVTEGTITLWMREPGSATQYMCRLGRGDAAVSEPGTLFQLVNETEAPVEVLYIVSPSYVYETAGPGQPPVYDESIMIARTWTELDSSAEARKRLAIDLPAMRRRRQESLARLAARKDLVPQPM